MNPEAPVTVNSDNYGTERDISNCPFFLKTGSCRFGDRCSLFVSIRRATVISPILNCWTVSLTNASEFFGNADVPGSMFIPQPAQL